MSATQPISKEEAVRQMVDWHFTIAPEIVEIYRFITPDEDSPESPIKLIDVSEATFASGNVDIFGFGPAEDMPYLSLTATVTPEEMEEIRAGAIPLPKDWNLNTAQHFTRHPEQASVQ